MLYHSYTVGGTLCHHGVLHQKWGERHGPPYPLDRSVSTGKRLKVDSKGRKIRTFKQVKRPVITPIPIGPVILWTDAITRHIAEKRLKKQDSMLHEPHRIKKGTTMYRATTDPNEKNEGSTYVTYQYVDRDQYRAYIGNNATRDGKKMYEKQFKLKEDLLIPSRDDVKDAFIQSLKKNGEKSIGKAMVDFIIGDRVRNNDITQAMNEYNKIDKIMKKIDKDPDKYGVKDGSNGEKLVVKITADTDKDFEYKVIDRFTNDEWSNAVTYKQAKNMVDNLIKEMDKGNISKFEMGMGTLTKNPKVKEDMIKILKSKGYNAMVDEAGVGSLPDGKGGINREGAETLIIFDRAKTLDDRKTKEYKMDRNTWSNYNKAMATYSRMGSRKRL